MNPESLPSALSDLFLPEVANPAGKSASDRDGQGTSPGSAADADRFEQYLSSARRSVTTDQALPAPAAADEHLAARADARRQPVERADRRQDRSLADRDDRRPVDDRVAEGDDRKDHAIDRDRTDRADDDRRIDDDSRTRSDDRTDSSSERGDVDEAADAGTTESAVATTEETDGEATADSAAAALAAAGLDAEIELDNDAPVAGADALVGAVDPATEIVTVERGADTALDGDRGDDADDQTETSLLAAQLDRAIDPNATVAAAAAATTTTDDLDSAGTEDLAIDLEGAGPDADLLADEAGPLDGDGAETDADADLDLDLTDGDRDTDGATDDGGQAIERSTTDQATAGETVADGTAGDGQTVAPIAGPVASTNSGSTGTNGQPVTGVDAVAGPAAPRNRTTNGPTSTQAGQQAQAPLADGEAGDPLWLQVRRAMGSLRTLQNGEQQMTIRLRPAELGSVMVRVNTGENGTTVSLIADSAVAATQLTQQRQQLISELEQGGLAGVAVDVGTGAETDLRDGTGDDRDPSDGSEADGTAAAAAVAGAGAGLPRTGGRGRRTGGSSGSLVDVEL